MVNNFNCPKCGCEFNFKSRFIAHQNRKTPCDIKKITKNNEPLEKLKVVSDNEPLEKHKVVSDNESLEKLKVVSDNEPLEKSIIELINKLEHKTKQKKVNKSESNKLNVLDLFCGCGGMTTGLVDAGLNLIAGIDIWDKAINNYQKNHKHKAICADLTKLPPDLFSDTHKINSKSIDIIVGGPPCFIAGTKILTKSNCSSVNYKNIEDVLLEDELLTHTGKFQKIVNLQSKTYSGDLYELYIKCHPEVIICTDEHPFFVREKLDETNFGAPLWKPVKELTLNDYYGMVINTNEIIPELENEKIDTDLTWYMLGYYICHNNEPTIPEWVQDGPKEFIQEFINGYKKASKTNNNILYTTSYNIAYGLQRLYLKLNKIFEINKISDTKYIIQESEGFIENNYVWYAPIKINKRYTIETIVYNFEVANDNSYIVSNIIVHNCQSFSIAGRRDKNDPRNSLFMEFVKYLNFFNPKGFIMENVIGILSKKTESNEKVIDIIMAQLTLNYNCIISKLYASDFEVPQNRRRAIIIGIRKNLNIIPKEPNVILKVDKRIPVKTILLNKDLVDKSYYLSKVAIEGIKNKKLKSIEKCAGFGAQYLDPEKPSYTIPARYWKDGYDALVKYNDTEIRRLTILELKRIQSFPDNYILDGSKKDVIMQIGNAVACRFAFHLGKHIQKLLNN